MRRDLIFFFHGIPEDMLVWDKDYFLSKVEPILVSEVTNLAKEYKDLEPLLRKSRGKFFAAGFRSEIEKLEDAFSNSYSRLSGILDAYSFLIDNPKIEIWPMIQVREAESSDASIKFFELKGWVRMNSKDGCAEKLWNERSKRLLEKFLPFFDAVANQNEPQTELRNQIEFSAKMFRHGFRSHAYGVEFLCKFSALEGLVCGNERYDKHKKLRERLSALIPSDEKVNSVIDKLWNLRCEGSHQAKAFSHEFSLLLPALDRLNLAVLTFAIGHINSAKTISELWSKAATYVLPAEVLMERPKEIPQFAILNFFIDTPVMCRGVGARVDQIFAEFDRAHRERRSSP